LKNVVLSSKRTRVSNAVAAGTAAVNCSILDMQGFESVVGVCSLNALTASQVTSIKAQAGNAANGSDMADLAGAVTPAAADADGNKLLVLEVVKPTNFRYLRFVINRGTANAQIDGVVATQYFSHKPPESDDATTVSKTLLSIDPEYANAALTVTTTTYNTSTTAIASTARTSS
jgi:hypothetical protein